MDILLLLVFVLCLICGDCEIFTVVSRGRGCGSTCRSYDTSEKMCSVIGSKFEPSGYSTKTECKCECVTRKQCDFFSEIVADRLSGCSVNKLDSVDEEILKQMGFNVAGAIAGNIPVLGGFFDVGFALWDPVGPVTSPFALANAIREEVTMAINGLKACVDEAISDVKLESVYGDMDSLSVRFQTTRNAFGDERINHILIAFSEFNSGLTKLFGGSSVLYSNYLEYSGMLNAFQALYPLYAIVATDRLIYLKCIKEDDPNFLNELEIAVSVFNTLKNWILKARDSILSHYDNKISSLGCVNIAEMKTELGKWDLDFATKYLYTLEKEIKLIQDIRNAAIKPAFVDIYDLGIQLSNPRGFWYPRGIGSMLNHGINDHNYLPYVLNNGLRGSFSDGMEMLLLDSVGTSYAAEEMDDRNTFFIHATDSSNSFQVSSQSGKVMGWQWMVWVHESNNDPIWADFDFFTYSDIVIYMTNEYFIPQCNADDCHFNKDINCQVCFSMTQPFEYPGLPQMYQKNNDLGIQLSNPRGFWHPREIGSMLNHGINDHEYLPYVQTYGLNGAFFSQMYKLFLENEAISFVLNDMVESNTFVIHATDTSNSFQVPSQSGKVMAWQWQVWVHESNNDPIWADFDFFIYSDIVIYMSDDNMVPQCNAGDCDLIKNENCQICFHNNFPLFRYPNLPEKYIGL